MLQQILRDMYVDPEILCELDDNQKQNLFCKMREEQVRRWKVWNDKYGGDVMNSKTKIKPNKTVNFLEGADGEPWVWVMGEHENDKTIEDILRDEAIETARHLAEKESEELLSDYMELSPQIEEFGPTSKFEINDDMDIYCSVEEIQKQIKKQPKNINNYSLNCYHNRSNERNFSDANDVLQKMSLNSQKVAQRIALWEEKRNQRTCEIFKKLQEKQREVVKEAEEEEKKKEQVWREQERKAKQAEKQIREIARRAREEHKLTSPIEVDASYSALNSAVPPGRNAVIEWYRNHEKGRHAGLDGFRNVQPWFHGLITRPEAEKLLHDKPDGTFLVRLSERIWGYAISYRAKDKCKHYLINAMPKYCFTGNNQLEHGSLGDLIIFHEKQPLTGGETLKYSCPRNSKVAIEELFQEK